MPKPSHIVIPGTVYGRLAFISDSGRLSSDKHKMSWWHCECGVVSEHQTRYVITGVTKSCGCLTHDTKPNLIHGMKGTTTYGSWQAMLRRCEKAEDKDFHRYGAVGIRVCERWKNFTSFYEDMGRRPKQTTIDRIDGTKGYEPGNCRWATAIVQARNNKRFAVVKTPIGVMPLIDYAAHIGISNGAAHLRLKRGKLEGCQRLCQSF